MGDCVGSDDPTVDDTFVLWLSIFAVVAAWKSGEPVVKQLLLGPNADLEQNAAASPTIH